MTLEFGVSTNAADIIKKLNKFSNKSIYVAHSKAEQRTVEAAQKKAKASMPKQLHRPTRPVINSVRRQFRKADKIKAGIGSSKVFVAPFLVDELWPNTVTEKNNTKKLEKKNPQGGKSGLLMPTKHLRNPQGNLRGFRSKQKLDEIRGSKKYFEVSVGAKVKGKHGYLKPGIYQIRQLKRSRKIRMVVAYKERRYITPKWKFRQIVRDCYGERWPAEFNKASREEIRKIFK